MDTLDSLTATPQIEVIPTEDFGPAGMPDGTVVESRNPDGTTSREKVVHDFDVNGKVVNYHKETVL